MSIRVAPRVQFDTLLDCYAGACAKGGPEVVRQFRLAGHRVEFRYGSPDLDGALSPALAHAEEDPGNPPDLTVHLWESSRSGVRAPSLPWHREDLARITSRSERIPRLYFDSERYRFLSTHSRNLLAYDKHDRRAVFWIQDVDELMQYEQAAPMRMMLQWYFSEFNIQLIHAAAVGNQNGLVLLTGKSGSGKSTTSLLCLEAGLDFCSDDYCAVDCKEPAIVHCLYSSAKLSPESFSMVRQFNRDEAHYQPDTSPKGVLYLARLRPEKIIRQGHVRGVIACRVAPRNESILSSTSRASVLRALAPSTVFQGPVDRQKSLSAMAGLLRQCPAYQLELGRDTRQIPTLLAGLLNRPG